jgi:hypothetical protein
MKFIIPAKWKSRKFVYERCGVTYTNIIFPFYEIIFRLYRPIFSIRLNSVSCLNDWTCNGEKCDYKDVPDSVTDNMPCEAFEFFE